MSRMFPQPALVGMALGICFFPLCHRAMAGGEGGSAGTRGGGNAVVCYASANKQDAQDIVSVRMFDYWEQPQNISPSLPIDLGPPSLGVLDKIKIALGRMRKFDPSRASRYEQEASDFLTNIALGHYLSDLDLSVVQDDDSRVRPAPPCYKTQFAIQEADPLPEERKLLISRVLWSSPETSPKTSNDARAGLLLHEIIYSDALDSGATDSDGVRYLNYLLATHYFDSASASDYLEILNRVGIEPTKSFSIPGQAEPLLYSKNEVIGNQNALEVGAPYHWEDDTKAIDLSRGDLVYLDENDQISGIKCFSGCGRRALKLFGQSFAFALDPNPENPDVELYPNGVPEKFFSAGNLSLEVLVSESDDPDFPDDSVTSWFSIQGGPSRDCGKQAWFKSAIGPDTPSFDSSIETYPSGNLRSACLSQTAHVEAVSVQGHFGLNDDGTLSEAFLAQPIQAIAENQKLTLDFRVRFDHGTIEYPESREVVPPFPDWKILATPDDAREICEDFLHYEGIVRFEASDPSQCSAAHQPVYRFVRDWRGWLVIDQYPDPCPVSYIASLDCLGFSPLTPEISQ